MSTGFLAPVARQRILTDVGIVAPGALLHTYVAGTPSTPLATYSDVGLTTPNANPIVASAGGLFPPIYLTPGVAYYLVCTTAAGVAIWDQDYVSVPGSATVANGGTGAVSFTAHGVLIGEGTSAIAATTAGTAGQVLTSNGAAADPTFQALPTADNGINDFRLTLTTGVPVTTADVLAATAIFATPMTGNRIGLADAAGVVTVVSSAQVTIALPGATSQVYDVFGYSNAGVFTLELLAWTNDTTRATALVLTTTGFYTKSGDLTRRYLGSVRTTTVAGQTEDSLLNRYLWNCYHRIERPLQRLETTASWAYNTNTIRQANAAVANQVNFLVGLSEEPVVCDLMVSVLQLTNTNNVAAGIGLDSTTAFASNQSVQAAQLPAQNMATLRAQYRGYPGVGKHSLMWLEDAGTAVTTTWFGATVTMNTITIAASMQSGLLGSVKG